MRRLRMDNKVSKAAADQQMQRLRSSRMPPKATAPVGSNRFHAALTGPRRKHCVAARPHPSVTTLLILLGVRESP
ncbi:hypothetical protein BDV93DRAFT_160016 [Ceratobasidium sp. AG-I]|nr:hypothetical protein BDV93DRAFT_160016 [Ceratobasidium sp. AG-I]